MASQVKLRWWVKWASRVGATVLLLGALTTWLTTEHFDAFGGQPSAASLARIQRSPRFVDGRFQNAEPTVLMAEGTSTYSWVSEWLGGKQLRVPNCPLPYAKDTALRLAQPPPSGLRVTWLGHSSTILEIDGTVILTDPMWSERASPAQWVGPKRFHAPVLALADLPRVDAVLISHEHYDHLDMGTVRALAARGVPFHVPLGIGGHLERWGVPQMQIVEHDWWQRDLLPGGLAIVSTPARHFNGRGFPGRLGALWTSWSLIGPTHRVFFSGDTGQTEAFRAIREKEGPFDVALLEIGQYHVSWGDIHLGPLGALEAFDRLGAETLIPIHWGTFELAFHAWSEPAESLHVEAEKRGIRLATPGLGKPVEPTLVRTSTAWWRALPPIAPVCPP